MAGTRKKPSTAAGALASASSCGSDGRGSRSEEHTSELQSQSNLVCRLLLEKKKKYDIYHSLGQQLAALCLSLHRDDCPDQTAKQEHYHDFLPISCTCSFTLSTHIACLHNQR